MLDAGAQSIGFRAVVYCVCIDLTTWNWRYRWLLNQTVQNSESCREFRGLGVRNNGQRERHAPQLERMRHTSTYKCSLSRARSAACGLWLCSERGSAPVALNAAGPACSLRVQAAGRTYTARAPCGWGAWPCSRASRPCEATSRTARGTPQRPCARKCARQRARRGRA